MLSVGPSLIVIFTSRGFELPTVDNLIIVDFSTKAHRLDIGAARF